jgi:hypothetical protein
MPSHAVIFFITALLCLPRTGTATAIHRCEAADGGITFTTMSCASDERLTQQEVRPYFPGTVVAVMPEANHEETSGMNTKRREPGIVGSREGKCANLIDARQRREAIINQRIIAGMDQRDVEAVLGKPDKVSIRNSSTAWQYKPKRGSSAMVSFDERGCVKEKAKSRTAKSPR